MNIINVTPTAHEELERLAKAEDKKFIRLKVVGGGCSGLSYKIDFDELKDKDQVIPLEETSLLIDPKSLIYLKDVTLDYRAGLNGKGFVFENPHAKNTCGCGESFSL